MRRVSRSARPAGNGLARGMFPVLPELMQGKGLQMTNQARLIGRCAWNPVDRDAGFSRFLNDINRASQPPACKRGQVADFRKALLSSPTRPPLSLEQWSFSDRGTLSDFHSDTHLHFSFNRQL